MALPPYRKVRFKMLRNAAHPDFCLPADGRVYEAPFEWLQQHGLLEPSIDKSTNKMTHDVPIEIIDHVDPKVRITSVFNTVDLEDDAHRNPEGWVG